LKQLLRDHPQSVVILIGAGLDSRAYRFETGSWVEVDETGIIEYKNKVLPASECRNKLERIAIDFEKDKLSDKLSPYTGRLYTIIIIEGVFLYLNHHQKTELLDTLTTLFPKHTLLCDLMKKDFFIKYGGELHKKLVEQGTAFTDIEQEPDRLFIDKWYKQTFATSTIRTAKNLGLVRIPGLLLNIFFKKLERGYAVYCFVHN